MTALPADTAPVPARLNSAFRRKLRPAFRGGQELASSNVLDMRRDRSLIASSHLLKDTKIEGTRHKAEPWMAESWTMFDIVGELHFLSTTLARRASRARFLVGNVIDGAVVEFEKPVAGAVANPNAKLERNVKYLFDSLGDGFLGVQEIVERAFLNQFVVGTCYLVGAPADTWVGQPPVPVDTVPVQALIWKTLSVSEFIQNESGYELRQTGSTNTSPTIKFPKNALYVIQIWQSHPADTSVPDSPVRATLPILRELVGLTQHVSAQIDSRLAGAGMLIMRASASRAIKMALGLPPDDPRDPFTEMLIEAMVTPIADRDSASAVVPYVVTIPDDTAKPEYIAFSAPLDQFASPLREEAIRRIALSLDAPPELLLGQGDANHWSAWLTQSEVVESHISPTLALIARALTVDFLRPILRMNGFTPEQAQKYAIWFDTSDLVVQANQGANAQALYGMDAISDETLRAANGFDETDAPKKTDVKDQAIQIVTTMYEINPGLANRPGLDVMLDQTIALLNGTPQSGLAAAAASTASSGGTIAPVLPGAPAAPLAPTTPAAPDALPARSTTPARGQAPGRPTPARALPTTATGTPPTQSAAAAAALIEMFSGKSPALPAVAQFGSWDD